MLKRAYKGIYHRSTPKHLNRYVQEFAGNLNVRSLDTVHQMAALVASMEGKRLTYEDLVS